MREKRAAPEAMPGSADVPVSASVASSPRYLPPTSTPVSPGVVSKTASTGSLPAAATLRSRFTTLVDGFVELQQEIGECLANLENREARWAQLMQEVEDNLTAAASRTYLNVGGRTFATAKENLLRWEGTYFHALLGGGKWQPCDDGTYFIDRDPDLFGRIMASFRTGKVVDLTGVPDAEQLRAELDYFQLPSTGGVPSNPTWEVIRWDAERCSSNLVLSDDGCTVTKTGGGNGWNAAAFTATPDIPNFRVRIRSQSCNIMVGYVRSEEGRTSSPNYNRSGWFIQCGLGNLYSGYGDSGRAYRTALRQGDLLEVQYDKDAGEVTFAVNGASHGIAFTAVRPGEGHLVPCIECYNPGASLTLEGSTSTPFKESRGFSRAI